MSKFVEVKKPIDIEDGFDSVLEGFVATPEEKNRAEASIKEFRTLVKIATKRGLNYKLLLHDPYLEDEEAANSLSDDLQSTFLEEEYRELQSKDWFYIPPVSAANLHPPSSAAAKEARAIARNTLVDILGPRLGQTPNTIGVSHIPRPLRLHRTLKAKERSAGGPSYIPLETVTASRTTTHRYSTNLKFSNVARFEGESRIPKEFSQETKKKGKLNPKIVKAQATIVNDEDDDDDDGFDMDSDSEIDEIEPPNGVLISMPVKDHISTNAETKNEDSDSKMNETNNNVDETPLLNTSIDAWWDDECEEDDDKEDDDGISMSTDDENDWSDVVLVVAAASDVDFESMNKTEQPTKLNSNDQLSKRTRRTASSSTIELESSSNTPLQNSLDRSVFRKFVSPSLSFSKVPTSTSMKSKLEKGTSSLSDREWFRLCLVRATQKWRQSRKLMSFEAQSFSNDLAAALESVMKRVHGGISFGPVKGNKDLSKMSTAKSRLRVRELLKKISKARLTSRARGSERVEPLVPISKLAGDNLRPSRSRSGARNPTVWEKEAKAKAFSENARSKSASRRAALDEVQRRQSLDNSSITATTTDAPGVGKFSSGRERIIAVKDKFFGVRKVLVPFTATVESVTEAEIAKGSITPGPGAHTILPTHSTHFGPHRRSSAPVFPTAGRSKDKASRSSLFRAMSERVDDELGVWEKGSSAAEEGDIVEISHNVHRPNSINAPHVGFNKAQRVPETFFETEAAQIWGGDELTEVKTARNLAKLSRKISRAVRFIQEQEQEQKEAWYVSERARNALQASSSQFPRAIAFLEKTITESHRSSAAAAAVHSTGKNSLDLQSLNSYLDELLQVSENIEPKKNAATTVSSRYLA
jgi:hypothetical protein